MIRTKALQLAAEIEAMGYIMYGERVAVVRDDEEKQTKGGIIIPDDSRGKPLSGTIVMIGLAIKREQLENGKDSKYRDLALGDWLTFSKFDGTVHAIYMADNRKELVEVMHGADIYIGSKGRTE